ncbi:MAG: DUF1792 domain-containing protein [Bacteroidales bacterium]|nr:DUF1792 domain-containing protein [Bacteroidales bacterium]
MSFYAKSSFESFDFLKDHLLKYKKLFFTRFGDGEVISIMGRDHRNYKSSPELTSELQESFLIDNPQYLIALSVNMPFEKGMSRGLFAPYRKNDEFEDFIINQLKTKKEAYESQIMFHYLSVFKPRWMYEFFEEFIRPKKKMFVGCTPLEIVEKLYGKTDYYVNVPSRHAYDSINEWWPEILKNIDNIELLIPSAGAATNVINKRLWFMNKEIHSIDIGSIIDAVDYTISRTWIRLKGHKIQKLLPPDQREKRLSKRIQFVLKDIKYFFRKFINRK